MPGMVTQIGILAASDADVAGVAAAVKAALAATEAIEVLTWQEAVPEMVGLVEIDNAFGIIYLVVVYAVVLFSITNTFLMAVMERVREFGLLNALGLSGGRVGRLMLNESVLMTILAMVIGFALGLAGHLAVAHWGISMAAWGIEEMEAAGVDFSDLVVYSVINPTKWIIGSAAVALVTVASAVYPAWRASRLAPAEAMRFYE
jgi:ABC-type lipoprotein release transport system permease subunit